MGYVTGFIVAVPRANKEAYRSHASEAWGTFAEHGFDRLVEAWASDVPEGKVTDFRKAVEAQEDEDVVFSFFEFASREARDAADARMMADPRMEAMARDMPFDGKRMVYGGFAPLLDVGEGRGGYVDGFVLPVPESRRDDYIAMAQKASATFLRYGALRLVEAWGDDVRDGEVTDFRRAVQAQEGEAVVFSWLEWPDKAVRDAAWAKMMDDPEMQPDPANTPFDGKRMFWGGFDMLFDSAADEGQTATA